MIEKIRQPDHLLFAVNVHLGSGNLFRPEQTKTKQPELGLLELLEDSLSRYLGEQTASI